MRRSHPLLSWQNAGLSQVIIDAGARKLHLVQWSVSGSRKRNRIGVYATYAGMSLEVTQAQSQGEEVVANPHRSCEETARLERSCTSGTSAVRSKPRPPRGDRRDRSGQRSWVVAGGEIAAVDRLREIKPDSVNVWLPDLANCAGDGVRADSISVSPFVCSGAAQRRELGPRRRVHQLPNHIWKVVLHYVQSGPQRFCEWSQCALQSIPPQFENGFVYRQNRTHQEWRFQPTPHAKVGCYRKSKH